MVTGITRINIVLDGLAWQGNFASAVGFGLGSGSTAIGSESSISLDLSVLIDMDGMSRSNPPDLGAYQERIFCAGI